MKFAVCFCVHSGELEIQALLLVASLRKHWPAEVELIGCIPEEPEFGGLSDDSRRAFASLGVRLEDIANPIGKGYPIANKLLCLDVATEADRIIFLDSDILATRPATEGDLNDAFGSGFVAKPADLNTSTLDCNGWESLYAEFGLGSPDYSVKATNTGEEMAPYFNSGVLSTNAHSGIGILWAFYFNEVARTNPDLAELHVFDQIPLSLALAKLGERVRLLEPAWNFPAHLEPLGVLQPKLCHYHWPKVISREPALLKLASRLAADVPRLVDLMHQSGTWTQLAEVIRVNGPAAQ